MRALYLSVLAGLFVSACTTTGTSGTSDLGMGDTSSPATGFGIIARDYSDDPFFGYQLRSADGWDAELSFVDGERVPQVDMQLGQGGPLEETVRLDIAMPYLADGQRRYHGTTRDGRDVSVSLQAGPCDAERSSHFARVEIGETVLEGCGREVASIDRWSNYLMTYLPAIDLCLGEVGPSARHVSLAYPIGENTGVRIVDGEDATWECVTRDADDAVNSVRMLDAADVIFGEGDPIFVRRRVPDVGSDCYAYETVRRADGELIGAFGHEVCDLGSGPVSQSQPLNALGKLARLTAF